MATKIFVNLPVHLQKSIEFFTKLVFTFNPQFTDATGHLHGGVRGHFRDVAHRGEV